MSRNVRDLNRRALEPSRSVVIEACAGSGKTWLLVSRIVRLMLAGVQPSQILAITFTRKAAQEMAARLRTWLRDLAEADDDAARKFLLDREVPASEVTALLPKARTLYEEFLIAQPPLTITTFHSWFLQLLKRAPLDATAVGDAVLIEQTAELIEDAWQRLAAELQRDRASAAARGLEALFARYGLGNTRTLLRAFLMRRADWWAYTRGERDPVAFALERLRAEMLVQPDEDVLGALFADMSFIADLHQCADLLDRNTPTDKKSAVTLRNALTLTELAACFANSCSAFLTNDGTPFARSASAAQVRRLGVEGERRLLELHRRLSARLVIARQQLADQQAYCLNEAGLPAGVALLDAYQRAKRDQRVIDFADVEWLTYELLSSSEHAAYMHYKLDARYHHILLDEFQDTNPLQWLTLDAWFDAADAADARPTVFVVGDPKQSIYRFRRAEARLFSRMRDYLKTRYAADTELEQDESRRCAPPIIELVNRLFAGVAGFSQHAAHYERKPGRIEILPLATRSTTLAPPALANALLRDPLASPLIEEEDSWREFEAQQLVEGIRKIVDGWTMLGEDGSTQHPARYEDVLVLIKRRTHLETYERALRRANIPFVTSRQGGLLDTLEAQDLIAVLQFLVAPFENLKLAHALRSPLFSCSDDDLVTLASAVGGTWWERLQRLAPGETSAALQRARRLLERWLARADTLPVHDQLDRIYFEGDVMRRYDAAVPAALQGSVAANLRAFIQRALDSDSGRYPSLPRFLHELVELRDAPLQEAPDEGIIGDAGDAVRILTVHGAKGLEAPVVWLLDAAAGPGNDRAYDVMVDWPPDAVAPRHVSLRSIKDEHSSAQIRLAQEEALLTARENVNLLYVAITRAKQALIVSGSEERGAGDSWFERIRTALGGPEAEASSPITVGDDLSAIQSSRTRVATVDAIPPALPVLRAPLATGVRKQVVTGRGQRYGSHFHTLMERLTSKPAPEALQMRRNLGLSEREFGPLWKQAQGVLNNMALSRFFDPRQFVAAANEVPLVLRSGEQRRIDRLVEFVDEVWVIDYKTSALKGADEITLRGYQMQITEYRDAIRSIYPDRKVSGVIVFADADIVYID